MAEKASDEKARGRPLYDPLAPQRSRSEETKHSNSRQRQLRRGGGEGGRSRTNAGKKGGKRRGGVLKKRWENTTGDVSGSRSTMIYT